MRSRTRKNQRRARHRLPAAMLAFTAFVFPLVVPTAAIAAPILTVEPITWNVVGLDSNDVTVGPNVFPVGARVCNTGDAAATNVVATFVWDTSNALIDLTGASTVTVDTLAAGSCSDFMFDVGITRSAAAYDTVRGYHIDVTADGLVTISTPTPREIYVERLVSQARNSIQSISGPSTVLVGGTYDFTLVASTATNGYEQLETFLTFPNVIFRIDAVASTYSAPPGATNDTMYADACGWDNDPASPTYRECAGADKAGGDITTVFTVTILSAGSADLTALIYDFSGSSYHYNGDYGIAVHSVTAVDSADLSIAKSDGTDPVLAGENLDYTLSVANAGPSDAADISVSDTLPAGTSYVSASGTGWSCAHLGGTVTCTRPALAAVTTAPDITVTVTAPDNGGSIANTATVTSSTGDPDTTNDSDTENTTVTASADLALISLDDPDPVLVGEEVAYTLRIDNHGPSDATNVTVTDTLPAGTTFVSASGNGWSCSEAAGVVTCTRPGLASGTSAPDVTITVTAPSSAGTITNDAEVTSAENDSAPGNNDDTEDTLVQAPPPNNPPVAADDSALTAFETAVAIGVTANDSDVDGNLDPSTVQVTSGPSDGTVSCSASGVCTYTPRTGFSGTDQFDYSVCDTAGACDTATVTITVAAAVVPPPVNNPPVAADDSALTAFETAVAIGVTANDSDVDGNLDPSTVQVTSGPSNGTVACAASGACTYTPSTGFSGTDQFDYSVCDTLGACDTATVTITVAAAVPPANDPPVAVDDAGTTPQGTAVALGVSANDSDPDGNLDPSSVQVVSGPSNGTVSCAANGVCTYTPAAGFSGTDAFDYTICDAAGACDTATATIVVTALPAPQPTPTPTPSPSVQPSPQPSPSPGPAPDAVDDSARTGSGVAVVIDVTPNDDAPGNQELVLTDHTDPKHGTVECTTAGVCTYSPDPGYTGTDHFQYTICDENGQCDTADVRVNVVGADAVVVRSRPSAPAPVPVEIATDVLPFTGAPITTLTRLLVLLLISGGAMLLLSGVTGPAGTAKAPAVASTGPSRAVGTARSGSGRAGTRSDTWAFGPVNPRALRKRFH